MQRFFDLASFKGEKGEKTRDSNIFRKYGLGIHQPTRKTLLKVEKVSPGSSRILDELIWKVLLCEHFTHNKCQRMLKCLPLEIRNLIFAKDSHGRLQRVSEQDIVSWLNGRYEIATLTTYTNLSKESIYTQDWPLADFWSKHLFLVFLGLCRYLKFAGIGDAMLPIFESLIFSRTVTGAKRYRELPELFHNMGGASPLSSMKERKSFICFVGKGWINSGPRY